MPYSMARSVLTAQWVRFAFAAVCMSASLAILCAACMPAGEQSSPTNAARPTMSSQASDTTPRQGATAPPAATAGESTQLGWLHKIPCAAPCWQGVTPGQTSAEEAIQILSRQPYLEQVQFDDSYTISWRWAGENWKSYADYDSDTPARTISAIRPGFTYWFSLADVIQAYGEPTHVIARTVHDSGKTYYTLQYFYLSQGIMLVYPSRGEYKPPLKASSRFGEVTFFSPSQDGLVAAEGRDTDTLKLLKPWEGFRDFDYYCVDYPAFMPCK